MVEEKRTVLFVDDEVNILNSIKRQLRNGEFSFILAESGGEALKIIGENDIQVIVTDEQMPDMGGIELLKKVKELYPDIVRIILSGYTNSERMIDSINLGEIYRFISKPWTEEELVNTVKEGFTRYNTLQGFKVYMKRMVDYNTELMKKMKYYESFFNINSDFLNMISQPIIAVSDTGTALSVNKASLDFFGEKILNCIHIKEIFGESITKLIMSSFELPDGQTSFTVKYNDISIRIYTRSAGGQQKFKGLLFIEKSCLEV